MTDAGRAYLSGGHVYCARRRDDRDITQCLECPSLKEVSQKSSPPFIVCDAVQGAADPLYISWWHQHHRRSRTA